LFLDLLFFKSLRYQILTKELTVFTSGFSFNFIPIIFSIT